MKKKLRKIKVLDIKVKNYYYLNDQIMHVGPGLWNCKNESGVNLYKRGKNDNDYHGIQIHISFIDKEIKTF